MTLKSPLSVITVMVSKNGFFEKPVQDFLLVVNRDDSVKLFI